MQEFLQEGWMPRLLLGEEAILKQYKSVPGQCTRMAGASVMKKVSSLQTPTEVMAIFSMPENVREEKKGWVIALDDIRDPGNLGTIIRIADWFGFSAVVCSGGCADPFNPKTVQASMGSLARVPVWETDLSAYFEHNSQLPVYAASLDGKPYAGVTFPESGILLIGNEGKGISRDLLDKATLQVTIPRIGKAESLNAAVATAIICSGIVSSRLS